MQTQVNRYSQAELEEFKGLITTKLEVANSQLGKFQEQLQDANEDDEDHGTDMMDDGNVSAQIEMINNMIHRQQKHIRDLENALLRIKNKSYGICVVTGELIDKKRMLAVLTTTKSLAAKNLIANPPKEVKPMIKRTTTPQSFSRVIKKVNPNAPPKVTPEPEDEDYDDDDYEDDDDLMADDGNIDLDGLSDEDLD